MLSTVWTAHIYLGREWRGDSPDEARAAHVPLLLHRPQSEQTVTCTQKQAANECTQRIRKTQATDQRNKPDEGYLGCYTL
jgi:hypothetical protein